MLNAIAKKHLQKVSQLKSQPKLTTFTTKSESEYTPLQLATISSEMKFTQFLVEHDIPLAGSDHVGKLFKSMFVNQTIDGKEINSNNSQGVPEKALQLFTS